MQGNVYYFLVHEFFVLLSNMFELFHKLHRYLIPSFFLLQLLLYSILQCCLMLSNLFLICILGIGYQLLKEKFSV